MENKNLQTLLAIEVACATAEAQAIIPVQVPAGTCIAEAIRLSNILTRFPEIQLNGDLVVGIFGKRRSLSWQIVDGDDHAG